MRVPPITMNTAPALTPYNTGLLVWLKADAIVGHSDGDAIGTWSDSSGNSNDATQATGGQKPIYKVNIVNGRPVLRFTAANSSNMHYPGANSGGASQAYYIFVVGALNEDASSETAYAPFLIGGGSNDIRISCKLSTNNWGTYVGSDLSSGNVLSNGVFNLLEVGYKLASINSGAELRQNGGSALATSGSTMLGSADSVNHIGAEPGATRYIEGDIAEILIYNTADIMANTPRQKTENYLIAKYGLP